MALTFSWPGPPLLATTTDGRKDFAGLVETDASGNARPGIFPSHANPLVSARTDMNVDVAIFQACAVQFGGPIFFANDGVAQLQSVLVSPVAGNNFYVVYAKINESDSPGTDPNNSKVLGAVLSTSSFTTARSSGARLDGSGTGLPTGAVELSTVQIPSGKTATNQSGVVITPSHQFTATEGGTVWLRDAAQQTAWSPADGASAYRLDLGMYVDRVGGAWAVRGGGCSLRTAAVHTSVGVLSPTPIVWGIEDYDTDAYHDIVTNPARIYPPAPGLYTLTAKARFGSTTFAGGLIIRRNGLADASSRVLTPPWNGAGIGSFPEISKTYQLALGEYLEVCSTTEATGLDTVAAECFAEIKRIG